LPRTVRRRYLALAIDTQEVLSSKDLMDAVWDAVSKLYGEYGASKAGLALISYDVDKKLAIIRTVHSALEMVRAALASITSIRNKPAAIHVITVSGTIKTLSRKIRL